MAEMKRYAVFGMDNYYPGGGWSDLDRTFDDPSEAMAAAELACKERRYEWYQIVDLHLGKDITREIPTSAKGGDENGNDK